jgi:hypothetical protein
LIFFFFFFGSFYTGSVFNTLTREGLPPPPPPPPTPPPCMVRARKLTKSGRIMSPVQNKSGTMR